MQKSDLEALLTRYGVMVQNSHIVYTSGKHGNAYFNKDAIYPHTEVTKVLCTMIAERFALYAPDFVIAPAVGGVALSQWTADALTQMCQREVLAIYADKDEENKGQFVVRRGYDKMCFGMRGIVLDDVLTTGDSAKNVVIATRQIGAEIVAAGALCNRGAVIAPDLLVLELYSIWELQLEAWGAHNCPLCHDHVPINTDVGKGREFLARIATQDSGPPFQA
jgi:orotate phosphoribosyltransferase